MLVPATPPVSRAFGQRIEFAPDQVVPHKPADFIRGQGEAVRDEEQLLLFVGIADHEEARACAGRDSKQSLQDTAEVLDVAVNRGFPSKLTANAVVPMTEVRRRRDRQVNAFRRHRTGRLLGIAADNVTFVHHVISFSSLMLAWRPFPGKR